MVKAIWGWLTVLTIIYIHLSKQIEFFIDLWLTPAVHLQSCHQNFGFLSPFNGHQSRCMQRCLTPWSPWSITGSGGHATKSIVAKTKMSWTWTSAAMATLASKWDLDSRTAAQHIMGSADIYNKNISVSVMGAWKPQRQCLCKLHGGHFHWPSYPQYGLVPLEMSSCPPIIRARPEVGKILGCYYILEILIMFEKTLKKHV